MYRLSSRVSAIGKLAKNGPFLESIRAISYTLPTIPLLDNIKVSKSDFQGLYSHNTVDELWFKRGQELVNGLNQLLRENKITNPPSDLNELITLTFNKPELYGIYSYASLLHNHQFTLETLKPNSDFSGELLRLLAADLLKTPSVETTFSNEPTDPALREWICDSFGSIQEFRTLLLNSAQSIKGDGLTWVVAQATYSDSTIYKNASAANKTDTKYSNLSVMNTYNAGIVDDSIRSGQITKLKEQKRAKLASLKRKQQERENIDPQQGKPQENLTAELEQEIDVDKLVLGTVEEAEAATLHSDRKLLPLLAIDASMRNYLLDYGVFGKQQYLENVWNCIDWDIVAKRAPTRHKPSMDLNLNYFN